MKLQEGKTSSKQSQSFGEVFYNIGCGCLKGSDKCSDITGLILLSEHRFKFEWHSDNKIKPVILNRRSDNKIFTELEMQKNKDFERFLTSSRRGGWNTGIFSTPSTLSATSLTIRLTTQSCLRSFTILTSPTTPSGGVLREDQSCTIPAARASLLVGRVGEEPRRKVPFAQRQAAEIVNLESSHKDENDKEENGKKLDTKTVWQDRKRAVGRTARGWFQTRRKRWRPNGKGGISSAST